MSEALDAFGRFVMEKLRDRALENTDRTLRGHWKAPGLRKLQSDLGALNEEQRAVVRRLVRHVVDGAIHDFLFALQEANDLDDSIAVLVRGVNVAEESDGLHGEPFGESGWQARFSKYGRAPDQA